MLLIHGVPEAQTPGPSLLTPHSPRPPGASQGSWALTCILDAAVSTLPLSFPSYLQKRRLQEHTQLALCPRERRSKAAGEVPLPIKLNGTKAPCALQELPLPGSFCLHRSLPKSSFWALPSPEGLWHNLGPIIKGKGARSKSDGGSHTPNTHMHTHTHCSDTSAHPGTLTHLHTQTFCIDMHLLGFSFYQVKSLAISWQREINHEGSRKELYERTAP